ncbi:unnamed protein product [Enterobius vermicularis]|uniref:DNA_mis_repair domain-containing protein n=1 Tax=Enterobius vermicularis TaxID=51028 RepID=A0A158Q9I3_ENTVE|nr:unnamed protein product [Enterobius vermicularis]
MEFSQRFRMGVIHQLSEDVVNRIAAGEVMVRASNAVKELIENSLDAEATEIIITAKNGGLDLLKVQDNGKGILKEDMPLVCERFATSKLSKFEELESMSTFGFRGEALASLSYVSNVQIISKPRDANCAHAARYSNGKMEGEIRSSAGLDGTTIIAENLFLESESRRKALKNPAEEMSRIADVVIRYAIKNPNVSFTLRRCGSGCDFRTPGDGDVANVICSLIGPKAAEDLINLSFADSLLYFTLDGYMTRPTTSCTAQTLQFRQERQKTFFLFINGRSVECAQLKRALDAILATQNTFSPFVFLSLQIAPNRVDVNVHPTKSTVLFLEQDAIITAVQDYIGTVLENSVETYAVKAHGPVTGDNDLSAPSQSEAVSDLMLTPKSKKKHVIVVSEQLGGLQPSTEQAVTLKKIYAHQLVRTDAKERRLDEFVNSQNLSQVETVLVKPSTSNWREFNFSSLAAMKGEICKSTSLGLRGLFKDHTYVGAVDPSRALIQHGTSLYLINVRHCLRQYFYQLLVLSFGNFGNGAIETIPSLVDGYLPQLESLPTLVSTLAYDVDWDHEQTCFEGICWALADFFSPKAEYCSEEAFSVFGDQTCSWKTIYSDILFPSLKTSFLPPKTLASKVRRLADLTELYKVFERC